MESTPNRSITLYFDVPEKKLIDIDSILMGQSFEMRSITNGFDDNFMENMYNKDPYTHIVVDSLTRGANIYKVLQDVLENRRQLLDQNIYLQQNKY